MTPIEIKAGGRRSRWLQAPALIAFGFLGAILIGTVLLKLPAATTSHHGPLTWLEAFFTATSAACVTGLIVVDTASTFSTFGQGVILALFQLGGLGVMTLALLVLHALSGRASAETRDTASSTLLSAFMHGRAPRTLLYVLGATLLLEGIGALFLSSAIPEPDATWKGIFLSVSAFCNAGFDNLDAGLAPYASQFGVGLPLLILWLLGGLGFLVPVALWLKKQNPKKKLASEVRLVLWGTAVLLPLGALLFWLVEKDSLLAGHSPASQFFLSLFEGNTSRTAGFSLLDLGQAQSLTLLLMIPLMLIGGASGGTAGGMKIGTVWVFLAGLLAYLRGHERVHLLHRTVPFIVVRRAFLVITLMLLAQGSLSFLLAIFEHGNSFTLEALLFESASALGTVGLSTGITPELSAPSQIALAFGMFLGRLGPLTLIWALIRRAPESPISYPEYDFPIG